MTQIFFDKDDGGTPTRGQVKLEHTWDLTPLFPTPEAWTHDFAVLQRVYTAKEGLTWRLASPAFASSREQ